MNNSSNLLVLGATGRVGKLVAANLKKRQANLSVGTRRKANLEELADQFGASQYIDLDDPRTFDEALKNITGVFLINGYTVDMLVQSKALVDAAKRSGVKHIVHLGAFTLDHDAYSTVFAWHQMIEAYVRNSGVAWTNLHPNMFMQNFLSVWSIKGGFYNAYTSKAVGFTALEDVAEAATVILMEGPEKHNGKDYWFSADVLTPNQVADERQTVAESLASNDRYGLYVHGNGSWRRKLPKRCGTAWLSFRTSVRKGRARIVRPGRGRKNGLHWKHQGRYKATPGARAIVVEGLGENTRQ